MGKEQRSLLIRKQRKLSDLKPKFQRNIFGLFPKEIRQSLNKMTHLFPALLLAIAKLPLCLSTI